MWPGGIMYVYQGVGVLWRRLPENIIFHTQRIICGITFTSFLSGFPTIWSFDLFIVWIEFYLLYFYNPFFRILCCLQNKLYLAWCRSGPLEKNSNPSLHNPWCEYLKVGTKNKAESRLSPWLIVTLYSCKVTIKYFYAYLFGFEFL